MDTTAPLRFGPFELDIQGRTLRCAGQELRVRPRSFDVLVHLVRHRGRVVGKEELAEAVWAGLVVTDDSLVQCVRDVRLALGDENQRYVKTVPRRGYVFVAELQPSPQAAAPAENVVIPAAAAGVPGRPLRRSARFAALGVLVLVLVLAAAAAWLLRPAPAPQRLTIAVLPLQTTGATTERLFGDGLTEDIITAVARFRDVTVLARNLSFRHRDDGDVVQLGRTLGAAFVLRGSVARDAQRARVSVQLIDTRDGATRWAERYERAVDAPFEVQDEVARQIVSQLVGRARLHTAERVGSMPPRSLPIYERVLRARQAFMSFRKPAALEAEALLEQALRDAPDYASAWELYSRLLLRFYVVAYDERHMSPAVARQAYDAAARAVALDPNLSIAHGALGYAQAWLGEFDAGLATLRRAVALNPNDPDSMRNLAEVLGRSGDHRASIVAFEQARALDSFTPPAVLGLMARAHNLLGEFAQAADAARQCAQRAPDLPVCHSMLAIAAAQLGQLDDASAAMQRYRALDPGATPARLTAPPRLHRDADRQRMTALLLAAGLPP
jgi:TolB-like protein/DNA-binding winged helix-turn-helix (wHTH) protein/Flp pilus assembly protein TadD